MQFLLFCIGRGPPSPTQIYKGAVCVPIFSGKGVFLGCLSREDFPLEKPKTGVF